MSIVVRAMNGIAPITCALTATTSGWITRRLHLEQPVVDQDVR
jgi:hypothetical protein